MKARYVSRTRGVTRSFSVAALLLGTLSPQLALAAETLFFASDVHFKLANLTSMASSYATSSELACILGDYASTSGNTSLEDYRQTYYTMASYAPFTIFTQGNHDLYSDGYYNAATGLNSNSNLQYKIYVINPNEFSTANTALSSFLSSYTENKVLFVLSHFPLHSTRSGLDQNAEKAIFNTLQSHGSSKDIVFLWGHNHSSTSNDTGVNYVVRPGGSIRPSGGSNVISSVATAVLTFTYLNAGYINPISGTNPSATVVTLRSNDITINRYGNLPQATTVNRRVAGVPCGNDSCSSTENACSCYEDCGSATGTCVGSCGDIGFGGCYCDTLCATYGDCCPDKQSVCGC